MQDTSIEADFVITVVLPGIVLDHIEKFSNKKQDPMFRMILVEKQNKIKTSTWKEEKSNQHRNPRPSL